MKRKTQKQKQELIIKIFQKHLGKELQKAIKEK